MAYSRLTLVFFLLGLSAWSCSSKARLDTMPGGASAHFVDLNLQLTTPCDLPPDVDEDDEIVISKDGYRTVTTRLSELPQIADGTYRIKLAPQGGR